MPLFILIAATITLPCSAEDTVASSSPASVEQMVKRINERYDDFYRYRREQDERDERLKKAASGERRATEKMRAENLEKARQQYVKQRKARPSDEALRLRHEAAQKDRNANLEMVRKRYVQQRDTAEQYLKKGRMIPELKEFDLEGY